MEKFILQNIKAPGRVNLPGLGTINLQDITDELAQKLYDQGLPFLKPTPAHRSELFPEQVPISTKKIKPLPQSKTPPPISPD